MRATPDTQRRERGFSMVEVLIALIIMAIGIFSVARMFPAGARGQVQDRLTVGASDYVQEKQEYLHGLSWSDPDLTDGRHPAGTAMESIGNGRWQRFYVVTTMASPLDNLKKVDVTVSWSGAGVTGRSVTTTTYVRR
jgi:prepilin-type N-terminal cleavage/methylation domain-containing protein